MTTGKTHKNISKTLPKCQAGGAEGDIKVEELYPEITCWLQGISGDLPGDSIGDGSEQSCRGTAQVAEVPLHVIQLGACSHTLSVIKKDISEKNTKDVDHKAQEQKRPEQRFQGA